MGRLTPREVELMTVLWERGPSTVAEVRDALDDGSAYTTILTLLRVLEEKGHVVREAEGRAHRYGALIDRDEASSTAIDRVLGQFFRGSPERLLTQMVSDRALDDATLRRLRALVDEKLDEKGDEKVDDKLDEKPRDRRTTKRGTGR
jgi:BlaI family transcriptional regulator, penicillinase repressor